MRLHRKRMIAYSFSWRRIHSYTGATATGRALKNEYEVTAYVSEHEHNDCIQVVHLTPLLPTYTDLAVLYTVTDCSFYEKRWPQSVYFSRVD